MGCQVGAEESISIERAIALIGDYPRVAGTETRPLALLLGRFLAEDVVATEPVPAHASSAMDGYAFRHADLADGGRLPVHGRVAAGHPLGEPLPQGAATRIFTGGMLPAGADTVAMQEECVADGTFVQLPSSLARGTNCRSVGDDIAAGTKVLVAGSRLRPQEIGVAASVGHAVLAVHRRARVGLLTTGDELRPPGVALPPGCVRDSNRYTIAAAVHSLGAEATDYGIVPDHQDAIRDVLLTAAVENDVVISTGGVSVGDEDWVRPAVEEVGSLNFWRLPLKPGRPIAVGEVKGTPFIGLPGNPVSSLIAFWLIGRPLILHLMGASDLGYPHVPAIADFAHRRKPGRREFLRARLQLDEGGRALVSVYHSGGSGMLTSMTWSDGLVEIMEQTGDVRPGDLVRFVPYSGLLS